MIETVNFLPEWASPPGATISDFLEDQGRSIDDLARELGRPNYYTIFGSRESNSFVNLFQGNPLAKSGLRKYPWLTWSVMDGCAKHRIQETR